jgi:hypothetical protein
VLGDVVALCDIDSKRLGAKAARFPEARIYADFRKLLEEMAPKVDSVVVSTPDHTHAPAALMAMRLGKPVYCQKPLAHSPYEARLMRESGEKPKDSTEARSKNNDDATHKAEWVRAIRAGNPPIALSSFAYPGVLTEAMLLGNVAVRLGKPIEYNAVSGRVTNAPEDARLVRPEYRKGWEL